MSVVITNPPRVGRKLAEAFTRFGVATVHEAQGRVGLLASYLRPIYPGAKIAGSAVTVSLPAADNWMLHVVVEQCQAGDVVVVAPTSACDTGYFGELLACSLAARGVLGLVIEAGVRDLAALTRMQFPVWSRAIREAGRQCARCPVQEIARLTPSRLLGVPAEVRHGAGEVEDIDDGGDYTVYALESELRVAAQTGGPNQDEDPGHVNVGELRAVDDEVAPGARGLVEDRRELVVGVQVDLAAQIHRWRVTVIPVPLKRG